MHCAKVMTTAFGRLVDQYHASLRRLARLYVSNRAVAGEVVQDTWVDVIQGIWGFACPKRSCTTLSAPFSSRARRPIRTIGA